MTTSLHIFTSNQQLLTLAQVADVLRVNKRTVQREIQRGKLKALRVASRSPRVSVAALDDYLRNQTEAY